MKHILFSAIVIVLIGSCSDKNPVAKPSEQHAQLTDDGAWCWFSDPRAIYHHSENGIQVIAGWVKTDGTIEAGTIDVKLGAISTKVLYPKLQPDDHNNPAFVENSNGSVLALYTKHGNGMVYQNKTDAGGNVLSFSAPKNIDVIDSTELASYPNKTITYANPFNLKAENNRIYCFGRWTGFKPNMMWSDDGGESWSKAKVFLTNYPFEGGNRPYVKYCSDGVSKVHIVFTDGHPRNEPTNSVYYAYYEGGAFYRADGKKICDLDNMPFEPEQASLVYKANPESGKAWIFDIATNQQGSPVIAYTRYPTDLDHRYHYAIYKDGDWIDHEICNAGKWFPQTTDGIMEKEPNYSAGLSLHPLKPNIVYLSRPINGIFEIEKRITLDNGKTWKVIPITSASRYDNVRPVVPRNMKTGDDHVVLWMENERYIHYTDYKVNIRYFIDIKN